MGNASPPLIGEPIGLWTAWPKRPPAACPLPPLFPRSCAARTLRLHTLPAYSELSRTLLTTSGPASSLKGGLLSLPSVETPLIAPATWLECGPFLLFLRCGAPADPLLPSSPSCPGVLPRLRFRPTDCKERPVILRSSGALRRSAPVSAPARASHLPPSGWPHLRFGSGPSWRPPPPAVPELAF